MRDRLDDFDDLVPANRQRERACWQHRVAWTLHTAALVEDWRRRGAPLGTWADCAVSDDQAFVDPETLREAGIAYQRHRVQHQKPTRPPRPKRQGKWERDLAAATLGLHG